MWPLQAAQYPLILPCLGLNFAVKTKIMGQHGFFRWFRGSEISSTLPGSWNARGCGHKSKNWLLNAHLYGIVIIFQVIWGWFSPNFHTPRQACVGPWGAFLTTPEPPKPISSHRGPIWGRFGKVDFSTLYVPYWPPVPPILPCLGLNFDIKSKNMGQYGFFGRFRDSEILSTPPGSSNARGCGHKSKNWL